MRFNTWRIKPPHVSHSAAIPAAGGPVISTVVDRGSETLPELAGEDARATLPVRDIGGIFSRQAA